MSRDAEIRRQALERDGYRCQITGYGRTPEERERLRVHHWKRLGMGGSEERDVLDNLITLGPIIHEFEIHPGVSIPTKRIVKWDPHDEENGLIVEVRGEDGEWREMDRDGIWFVIRQMQMVVSQRARIMADVWRHYDLISDAASPEQFVAGLGLDARQAKAEATAAIWIEDNDLDWPTGVNVRKVLLIRSAVPQVDEHLRRTAQELLDRAVDARMNLKPATVRWYLRIGHQRAFGGQRITFIRSRDREAVLAKVAPDEMLVEINAFRTGIKWDRKTETLTDRQGKVIPHEEV